MRLFLIVCWMGLVGISINAQTKSRIKANGTNYAHRPGTIIKGGTDPLSVKKIGKGDPNLILISSHSQGSSMYEGFAKRNADFATFHIVTPPGMGASPAYPWPDESEDFISRSWSTQFERELVDYIKEEFDGPVFIMGTWITGTLFSLNVAKQLDPAELKGLILIGTSPYRKWNGNQDVGVFDLMEQRKTLNDRLVPFWRTVDENTWHNNMFPIHTYTENEMVGIKLKLAEARQPLNIYMRYFVEFMYHDVTPGLLAANVPIKVIAPVPSPDVMAKSMGFEPGMIQYNYEGRILGARAEWHADENEYIDFSYIDSRSLLLWTDKSDEFDLIFREFVRGK